MKKEYWLEGAILYTAIGLCLLATFLVLQWLNPVIPGLNAIGVFGARVLSFIGIFFIILFNPAWIIIAMDLGMRGEPASGDYVLKVHLIGLVVQIVYSFVIGSCIGFIYGKIKNRKKPTSTKDSLN
jgi:hypothetical protein